jgi:hypothetical protein
MPTKVMTKVDTLYDKLMNSIDNADIPEKLYKSYLFITEHPTIIKISLAYFLLG